MATAKEESPEKREPTPALADLRAFVDETVRDAFALTEAELLRVQDQRWSSFAHGAAGIAYFFLELHRSGGAAGALERARAWAELAEREHAADFEGSNKQEMRFGVFFGTGGIAYVKVALARASGDGRAEAASVGELADAWRNASALEDALDACSTAPGFVLAARDLLDRGVTNDALERLGQEAYDRTLQALDAPVLSRSGDTFLGVAHGIAGALLAAIRWDPTRPAVRSRLDELIDVASTGEGLILWPRVLGGDVPDMLVEGWCNGIAGHASLLTCAAETYGEPRYVEAARAALDTLQLMRVTHASVCCGASGQAISLFRGPTPLDRRRALARLRLGLPEARALGLGLTQGRTGIALAAMDVIARRVPRVPLFDAPGR